MSLSQIYKIARREYLALVKNKAFIFMTLLVPGFMALYLVALPFLFDGSEDKELAIIVVDQGTGLGEAIQARLESSDDLTVVVPERIAGSLTARADRDTLNTRVRNEEIDGYLILTPDEEIQLRGAYYARETGNPLLLRRIEGTVHAVALEQLLGGTGVDVDRVRSIQRSDLVTTTISDSGEERGGFEAAFISTFILGMLLYMAVLINGQQMAVSIVEEKSSRLIEVILGSVTATEFMAGKILGVLLSGLTQLGIWLGFALIALVMGLPSIAISSSVAGFDPMSILNPNLLFYFSLFFALGYLLYATLFAMVAATCTSTAELGQAMFPAMLPMIIALMLTFYAVPNPSAPVTVIFSFIPLFSPLVMLARINVLTPPVWQIAVSVALLLLGTAGIAWLAAKVFRVALLIHGKRPSIPEIYRLARGR